MTDNTAPLLKPLHLDASTPIAAEYLPIIDAAISEAEDRVPEAKLHKLVPRWFLNAVAAADIYDRRKEPRTDNFGGLRPQWIWSQSLAR